VTSAELLARLECTVRDALNGGYNESVCRGIVSRGIEMEYEADDRVLVLGLAFSCFRGEMLRLLVAALEFPKEQRLFIKVAKKRLAAGDAEERESLLKALAQLGEEYPELRASVNQVLEQSEAVTAAA
jgi:hypothetical protein